MLTTDFESKLTNLYGEYMGKMSISLKEGLLGRIENNRYKDEVLRFSGFPYIGAEYHKAKKKILFIGLDIGIDERRIDNTYHTIESRRTCIQWSENMREGKINYNPHIAGTYAVALYALKDYYDWNDAWKKLFAKNETTTQMALRVLSNELPNNVMDYVALTNVHKFVSLCRGCEKEVCWSEECKDAKILKNRSGGNNRKWYSKNKEIQFLMDEIELLNPDVIVFQGSARKLQADKLEKLKSKYIIIEAYHPSAWNVGANKVEYAKKIIDSVL